MNRLKKFPTNFENRDLSLWTCVATWGNVSVGRPEPPQNPKSFPSAGTFSEEDGGDGGAQPADLLLLEPLDQVVDVLAGFGAFVGADDFGDQAGFSDFAFVHP